MTKRIISQLKLGNRKQEAVYLIEQQLKARYFFDSLARLGLGSYEGEPNLDHLILKKLKLDDGADQTYTRYTEIMDSHTIAGHPPNSTTSAFKVYTLLKALRKQMKKNPHDTAGTPAGRV